MKEKRYNDCYLMYHLTVLGILSTMHTFVFQKSELGFSSSSRLPLLIGMTYKHCCTLMLTDSFNDNG
ncbi:hypothetical protein AQUCO_03400056v1 [Aquilegia coerulea]|uniref:Uncharacterized protein n=1 Tax=Aquilegia coerulea TaxID=218851 RepID=A0A2G5CXA3_AQUCA|nr:hypothetical protein AQUCO_03400056v1 [Aquilegia coerulea]